MAEKVKVLVVDDSAFMRKIVSDILVESGEIEVVGTARNGAEVLEKLKFLKPDVITLDVEMPVMDGLECLKKILAILNVPVIMLSSLTGEGADETIRALEYGAFDFIEKPTEAFGLTGANKRKELVEKVRIAKDSRISKRYNTNNVQIKVKNDIIRSNNIAKIVAIGTSTGGPRALQEVIPKIPGSIPAAILIVQHMPPGFTRSLAERLNALSELNVKEAEDGETLNAGCAYLAPGDYHMKLRPDMKIRLTKEPPESGHRPSVNAMMGSLADAGLQNVIAVIMTGMGNDGSVGIKKIKANKGYIIAQDEGSCVVYGMPRTAVQTGVVDAVVPLKEITHEIMKNVGVPY